jgi:replicative DNA helicase
MTERNVPMLVLRHLLTKSGWHALSGMVRVESFDSNEYRRIYQHVERLHEATESDLSVTALRADVEIQYSHSPDTAVELNLVLDRLEKTEALPADLVASMVRRFLQRSISFEIAQHILDNADKQEFSAHHVADLAARAVEVDQRVGETVVDVLASAASGAPDNRRSAYGLGCSRQLDIGLRGGVAPGELLIFLAPPSRGKTSFLCRAGASQAADGGRVLHVTLEINTRKVIERYDQAWTHKTSLELEEVGGPEAVRAARDIVKAAGGHVWVIDWSYMNVSAGDVGALVRRMRGTACGCGCGGTMAPDMVVVDYLELMSPTKAPGKEMRQGYAAVVREHRQLARNLDLPVLTAWQANRAGSGEMLLSLKDLSESWDAGKIVDIVVGLNQNPAELRNKRMKLNIIKQREGTNRGVYELYCDLDRVEIRDLTHDDQREQINAVLGRHDLLEMEADDDLGDDDDDD